LGVHQYQTQSAVLEGVWYAGIPGYTEDMWRGSALWQFLGSHPLKKEKTVYTNSHEAYYMGTRQNAQTLPHKDIAAERAAYQKEGSFYVVWFFNGENPDLMGAEQALAGKKIKKQFQLQDGWIAEVGD
jgi:hypothetical protein